MTSMLPPLFVKVRIRGRDTRGFRIWFPFFLLWPLLLVLLALCLLAALVADLALAAAGASYHRYTQLVLGAVSLLPETRGTQVHVHSDSNHVDLDIY